MENATKALLIAAAVLIVILVIALGMRIFNSTSGATSSATSTGETITSQTGIATSATIDSIADATSDIGGEESTPLKKVENYLNKKVTGNNKTKEQAITAINKIKEQDINGKFEGVSVCVALKSSLTGMTIRYDNNSYDRCVQDLEKKTCNSFDIDCAEVNDGVWVYVRYSGCY